jgi:TetR/AcrR family transcriptional regulator, transcriptional repressor for nem operon
MRVSKAESDANRVRILETASRLFRERGVDGTGIAELMADVGLTHGGFYGHFDSKEDLSTAACRHSAEETQRKWSARIDASPDDPLRALLDPYFTTRHRDAPGTGCFLVGMAVDSARAEQRSLRTAFTDGVRGCLDIVISAVAGRTKRDRRRRALATLSGMVGALILARAVDDPALSDEILDATRRELLAAP